MIILLMNMFHFQIRIFLRNLINEININILEVVCRFVRRCELWTLTSESQEGGREEAEEEDPCHGEVPSALKEGATNHSLYTGTRDTCTHSPYNKGAKLTPKLSKRIICRI